MTVPPGNRVENRNRYLLRQSPRGGMMQSGYPTFYDCKDSLPL
jgi:hypothetical protein